MLLRSLTAVGIVLLTASRVPAGTIDFSRDVRPILAEHCFSCHGPDESARKAKLRLDVRDGATAGKRPAVMPGKPGESELINRITSADPDEVMPPPKTGKKLSAAQTATLREWIAAGAAWSQHWSFVTPFRPELPAAQRADWPASAIDRFVLVRLESAGMSPSEPATREALIRRVNFDLIGLPPTPAEVDAFLADASKDAYERVVDRLLASPRFGEKWARQWLDLARYADSNGYQRDGFRTIWPWRDWVINALNADMPYEQFLAEQIAGDLMGGDKQKTVATGFFRNVTVNVEAGTIPEADRTKQVADRVNMFGSVFLGLTLECAQCHDHKYDPIPTRDYYKLFAYFNNTPIESRYRGKDAAAIDFVDGPSVLVGGTEQDLARRSKLKAELAALIKDCAADPDKQTLAKIKQLEKQIDAVPVVASLALQEELKPRSTHVLKRGQFDSPAEVVTPGTPAALHPLAASAESNRLGLAAWVADPKNPVVHRVAVNRWWAEIFGRGIVATQEDFGLKGEPPSHPELLDWLAVELREHRGSMKHVLRLILTSRTYRQSAKVTPVLLQNDPANTLLSRGPRHRLPAEAVRDNALSAAGLLSEKMFGPPVFPQQPDGLWRVTGKVDNTYYTSKGEDRYRRGLYTIWRRSAPYPSFLNFDATDRSVCVAARSRSNTPLQALTLLNDPVYTEAAEALGSRMAKDRPGAGSADRLRYGFKLCTGRDPKLAELESLSKALENEKSRSTESAAWTFIATVLLNLDETISR